LGISLSAIAYLWLQKGLKRAKKAIPLSDIAYFWAEFLELFGRVDHAYVKFWGSTLSLTKICQPNSIHIHALSDIQIVHQDLFPLVAESDKDKRLPSATINAFGASIQELFDGSDEGADFCIFSSWLAVLADGKVSENDEKNVGTFGDHVMLAVRAFMRSHTMF